VAAEPILTRLQALRPRQPRYLDRRLGGKMAADWNLIVPTSILTREWERVARGRRKVTTRPDRCKICAMAMRVARQGEPGEK